MKYIPHTVCGFVYICDSADLRRDLGLVNYIIFQYTSIKSFWLNPATKLQSLLLVIPEQRHLSFPWKPNSRKCCQWFTGLVTCMQWTAKTFWKVLGAEGLWKVSHYMTWALLPRASWCGVWTLNPNEALVSNDFDKKLTGTFQNAMVVQKSKRFGFFLTKFCGKRGPEKLFELDVSWDLARWLRFPSLAPRGNPVPEPASGLKIHGYVLAPDWSTPVRYHGLYRSVRAAWPRPPSASRPPSSFRLAFFPAPALFLAGFCKISRQG